MKLLLPLKFGNRLVVWSQFITYHDQIGSFNDSHCCHIFPWLCAWGGCTMICWRFHVYRGTAGLCFFHCFVVLWCVQIMGYIMAQLSHSFVCTLPNYHHYADASVECVSKIKSLFKIIFHAIYGAVCIQLTYFPYDDCESMCTLFYYYHQIGSMTHLPLFMVRS